MYIHVHIGGKSEIYNYPARKGELGLGVKMFACYARGAQFFFTTGAGLV